MIEDKNQWVSCFLVSRSRIVREESTLNLLSQMRPFKLECDRRAWRSLARSSPELRSSKSSSSRFKAKPVPRNLFGTEIYDRMLEDEYYRSAVRPFCRISYYFSFSKKLSGHFYAHLYCISRSSFSLSFFLANVNIARKTK